MLSVRGGDRNEATVDYYHHLQYSNHHQRRCSFSAMDDNELEEGEAYTGSDPNFDPDVALSYIDIKLQDVLGHFQKDFEGGVSAENLGAKYGGYGSFLPTHQRSPSVLLQNKMQAGIQNNDITRPLVDSGAEKMLSAAQNNGTKYVQSASVNASNTSAINLGDMSQKVGPSADVGKVNRQQSPSKKLSSKSNSTGDRKKLKLKIKMAPEPQQHGNNSALYNQLGLKITPSPSLEDSPINSQGCSLEGDSSLPSPLSIIQMMTFFEIPGGLLLSPLRDVLVKFPERFEKMASREQVRNRADTEPFEASTPAKEEIDVSKMSQSLKEKRGAWNENRSKYTNIKRDAAEPDLGRIHKNSIKISSKATSSDIYQGQVDTEYMADATKVGSKAPGESGKRKSKEKKLKAGSLKDESSDADKNRQTNKINDIEYGISPVPSDKQSYKLKVSDFSRENKEGASHKILKSEGKWSLSEMVKDEKNAVQSKVLTNNREKSNHKTDSISIDGFEDRLTGKEILDEDAGSLKGIKKKHKDVNSKMTSSKESLKEKSRDIINEPFKDSRIDKFRKDSLMSEPSSDLAKIRKESKHAAKIRQKDYHKGGLDLSSGKKDGVIYHRDGVKDAKQGSTDKTYSRMMENEKDREKLLTKSSSSKRLDHTSKAEDQVPVTTTHQPLTVGMGNETTGIPLAAPPQAQPQNPVVINEEWVMCDRCEKWRLLPFGPPMQLPKQWVCSMLSWLPNMNRCDISEDATTHALYALFGMQPPQAQVPGDGNDNPMQPSGALVQEPVPDMKHIDSIPGGKSQNATSYSAKKEEGPSGVTGSFVATSTSLKANKQTFSKSKNLNDVQLPAHKVQGLKGDDYMEGSKNRQKEKLKSKQSSADEGWDVGMGNSHTLKTKRKGETEYDMQKSVKKIKSEDVGFDACKNSLDTCSNGKIGPNNGDLLPSKTVVGKAKRYFKDSPSTKDLKGQKKDALLTTEKQAKEQFQTSLDTDSRGTYSSFDTDKFARKDLQGKKRKAIHDKENITELDGFTDKDYDGGYGNPTEDFSVTEYRKGKKTKISCSEGKASSTSKAEGKGEKIRAGSKNSLVKDIFSNGLEERNRGINEQDHIVSQSQPRGVVRRYSNGSDVPKRELVSAAAPASSSSKMSCSLKNVANANEERASPMESVSSSPFRSYKAEKLSLSRKNGFRTDDMIDSGLNGMASHGRCSDAEDDNRSYHSSPSKFDRVTVQDDLHENSRVIKVSKNRKSVEEKLEKSKKQSVNVNSKTGKHHKNMEKSNNDSRPSSLAHKYSRESLDLPEQQDKQSNERKDREYSHSKYNKDRENLTRVQEHNRNETPMRGKGKLNDSLSDSHEEFPVGKDASSKWHDEPLEGRNQSPYQERYKLSKEYPVAEKNVVKHDRERKSDPEWNAKNDARGKMLGDAGGKVNKIKIEKGENVDTNVSGIRLKSSKDSLTRHLDCGMPSKDGKPNLQQSSKQETGHGSVKKSAQAMNSRNVQPTSALSKGKSQVPGIESKLDSRDCNIEVKGNNSGSGISAKKGAYGVTANVYDVNLPASKESIKISNTDGASIKAISRIEKEVVAASPVRRECSQSPGQVVLKEATLLKHTADRLKNNGGDEFEFLRLYFEAALKFLLAASLLEPSNSEGGKIGEKNLSMKVYTDTAQLCRYCASQFEKIKEMAAAALAYKCMAVSHMRVVLFKTTCLNRDFLELQSSFQNAPPGESPSSSASDVDNLNNHVLMEKSTTALVKVDESSQVSGNHVIPSRQLPNFRRLLQYTHDVTASIEAFKKSETAFAVAVKMSDASNRTKEIPAVKTVIDFSFHDIEGLLRLVRLAMEALHH